MLHIIAHNVPSDIKNILYIILRLNIKGETPLTFAWNMLALTVKVAILRYRYRTVPFRYRYPDRYHYPDQINLNLKKR